MKVRITMKNPDALHDAINDASVAEVAAMNLDEEETDALAEIRKKNALEVAGKFFQYSEYITVELDTTAETCVVVPLK